MARKDNQQKNGPNHKKGVSGGVLPGVKGGHAKGGRVKVFPGEDLANGDRLNPCEASSAGDNNNNEQKSESFSSKEKQGVFAKHGMEEPLSFGSSSRDGSVNPDVPVQEVNGSLPRNNQGQQSLKSRLSYLLEGSHMRSMVENLELADNVMIRRLRLTASSIFTAANEWLTKQKPLFESCRSSILKARDNIRNKVEVAYPIVLKWLMHIGNIVLLLSLFWLDCAFRGIDSFVRMGTTSFFSVIWCSIFSVISMIGMLKFLVVLVSPDYSCHCFLSYYSYCDGEILVLESL